MSEQRAVEWRDIPGWEGRYRVSEDGQVFAVRLGRCLATHYSRRGYLRVTLTVNSVQGCTVYVHSLVLLAFHGPKPPGGETRHLDGNKLNNHYTNLRWGTKQENDADRMLHGRVARGERVSSSRLTEGAVREAWRMLQEGVPCRDIASRFGVSPSTIGHIAKGTRWQWLTSSLGPLPDGFADMRGHANARRRLTNATPAESAVQVHRIGGPNGAVNRMLDAAEPAGCTYRSPGSGLVCGYPEDHPMHDPMASSSDPETGYAEDGHPFQSERT